MNRKEAEDFVYRSYRKAEKYQDYRAKDAEKRRPDLTREMIRKRHSAPCVVVTGSKGKGSVSNMISQILQVKYNIGLITSPHLLDFCERFQVNGVRISDEDFTMYMNQIRPEIDEIDSQIPQDACVSPMGIQTALGLSCFKGKHTDFNVLECGKGARYDDVNNALHEYAVINTIFLEHTRELGGTLEEIAGDKSCVITGEQKCVYCAEQKKEVLDIIRRRAGRFGTPLKYYGKDFSAGHVRYTKDGMLFDVIIEEEKYADISVPLLGEHQAKNCALAMALCRDVLGTLDLEAVKEKLSKLDWPGRMEILSRDPFILLDACINAEGCRNVKDVMRHLSIRDAAVIIGIPDDKDYAGTAKAMQDVSSHMILTKSQNPHYVFTPRQQERLKKEGISAVWTDSIEEAVRRAESLSSAVVILGTASVVSEVKKLQLADRLI